MNDARDPLPENFRFPRTARLTRPSEFETTLRSPDCRLRSGPLRIAAVRNRMHSARLGLIVGKRAVPKAHSRNRVKRIIRNRFRLDQYRLEGFDLVVRVTAGVTDRELHQALDILFADLEKKACENPADP